MHCTEPPAITWPSRGMPSVRTCGTCTIFPEETVCPQAPWPAAGCFHPWAAASAIAVALRTRVDAGTLHAFHTSWITYLMETLNSGLLPAGYNALRAGGDTHAKGMLAQHLACCTSRDTFTACP